MLCPIVVAEVGIIKSELDRLRRTPLVVSPRGDPRGWRSRSSGGGSDEGAVTGWAGSCARIVHQHNAWVGSASERRPLRPIWKPSSDPPTHQSRRSITPYPIRCYIRFFSKKALEDSSWVPYNRDSRDSSDRLGRNWSGLRPRGAGAPVFVY